MRRFHLTFLLALSFLILPGSSVYSNSWDVKDMGALGEKEQLATQFFQIAIDSAYKAGGGTVYVPPGEYTIGTIVLKDNITLHLEAGATVYASRDIADYRMPLQNAIMSVMIYANGAQNVTIKGKGALDGQAVREYRPLEGVDPYIPKITENAKKVGVEMKMYYKVPPVTFLLFMTNCTGLTFEDFSMIESSFWTFHLLNCERVNIRGMYIYSSLETGVNADGIDLNACRDVRISDCTIITGDDAIVLKSWGVQDRDCENIVVTNCVLSSSSSALKIGTETYGNVKHVRFSNCEIRNSNRGLSIVVRDGGHISDIVFSNITVECSRRHFNWWGNGDAIYVTLDKRRASSKLGSIENITFENIIADARGTSKITSMVPDGIKNVQLNNIQLRMKHENYLDKRANHAFTAKNVSGMKLRNFQVSWATDTTEKNWQSALDFYGIKDLEVIGFRGRQGLIGDNSPVVLLQDVESAYFDDMETEKGTHKFFAVGGSKTKGIKFGRVDKKKHAHRRIGREPDLPAHAITILDQ